MSTPNTQPICNEDQACWDWATMGNHDMGYRGTEIDTPQPQDIAHCQQVGGEPVWNPTTLLLSCETQVARSLPTTGSTSTGIVGGAGVLLALGAILSIFARRGAI